MVNFDFFNRKKVIELQDKIDLLYDQIAELQYQLDKAKK